MFRISAAALIALPAIALLVEAAGVQPASAQRAQAGVPPSVSVADACSPGDAGFDERIAACTLYIDAAGGAKRERSLAFAYRGSAFSGKGNAARALTDYNDALRLDPANPLLLNLRALEFYDRGELGRAIGDAGEALRLEPGNAAALTIRGLAYERRKDVTRARADFTAALAQPAKDEGARRLQEIARGKLTELTGSAPATGGTTAAPSANASAAEALRPWEIASLGGARPLAPPAVPIDIKPLERQRTAVATSAPVAMPPELAQLESARQPLAEPPSVVTIPRLSPQHSGNVAPGPAPTEIAPAVNRQQEARPAPPPLPVQSMPIPPLGAASASSPQASPVPSGRAASATTPVRGAALPQPAASAALSGRGIALVIGNSSYLTLHYAPNPVNDASDMANALKQVGFAVTLGLDLRGADMNDMLARFAGDARSAETALVYYAGYGVAYKGENYLVPIDGRVRESADLRRLVRLGDLVEAAGAATKNRIVIVDASRENEMASQSPSNLPAATAPAFSHGLAALPDAAGILIVSAAQPNENAADAPGRNSVFTQALLKRLQPAPAMGVKALMKAVREDVIRGSGGKQRPDIADGLTGEFVLKATR